MEQLPIVKADSEWFGFDVDLSGNRQLLAVGAPLTSVEGKDRVGSVHIYERIDNQWQEQGNALVGSATNDFLGWSVSISSNPIRVATGGPSANGERGVVRIYEWSKWETRSQEKTLWHALEHPCPCRTMARFWLLA